MPKHLLEVYEDKAGEWRWRRKYGDDITADGGEGYSTRQGAMRAATSQFPDDDVTAHAEGQQPDDIGSDEETA